jgi:hypothetical protein
MLEEVVVRTAGGSGLVLTKLKIFILLLDGFSLSVTTQFTGMKTIHSTIANVSGTRTTSSSLN